MSCLLDSCIFCKIIKGIIPSHRIIETSHTLAFLDVNPLARGHVLIIPKFHAQFMHQLPDENLSEILVVTKKIAAVNSPRGNYNILQNNGRMAHQAVDHVHFHLIPKTEGEGLNIEWKTLTLDSEQLTASKQEIVNKLSE